MLYASARVDTPLAQLESICRTDLLRNLRALKRACADYAPQQSVENCVLKMNLDKPEAGPVAEARKQLVMLRQCVVDKKLVSIPRDELAPVNEATPFNRWNSRSEEHTSELQSLMRISYAVCCLKKNKHNHT